MAKAKAKKAGAAKPKAEAGVKAGTEMPVAEAGLDEGEAEPEPVPAEQPQTEEHGGDIPASIAPFGPEGAFKVLQFSGPEECRVYNHNGQAVSAVLPLRECQRLASRWNAQNKVKFEVNITG